MVLFPSFTALDAFGPLNALNILSAQHPMTLALVAADLAPQSVDRNIVDGVWYPSPLAPNSASPFFTEFVLPTHTFAGTAAGAGSQFDVIFVPGGGGTRNESATQPAVDWLAARLAGGADGAPVRFVMSDCTGAALLARTGRLAGRRATTNKAAFRWVRDEVPGAAAMTWVPRARWVVDGNLCKPAFGALPGGGTDGHSGHRDQLRRQRRHRHDARLDRARLRPRRERAHPHRHGVERAGPGRRPVRRALRPGLKRRRGAGYVAGGPCVSDGDQPRETRPRACLYLAGAGVMRLPIEPMRQIDTRAALLACRCGFGAAGLR